MYCDLAVTMSMPCLCHVLCIWLDEEEVPWRDCDVFWIFDCLTFCHNHVRAGAFHSFNKSALTCLYKWTHPLCQPTDSQLASHSIIYLLWSFKRIQQLNDIRMFQRPHNIYFSLQTFEFFLWPTDLGNELQGYNLHNSRENKQNYSQCRTIIYIMYQYWQESLKKAIYLKRKQI